MRVLLCIAVLMVKYCVVFFGLWTAHFLLSEIGEEDYGTGAFWKSIVETQTDYFIYLGLTSIGLILLAHLLALWRGWRLQSVLSVLLPLPVLTMVFFPSVFMTMFLVQVAFLLWSKNLDGYGIREIIRSVEEK